MRAMVLLASLLVVGAALTGCVGQAGEDDPEAASVGDGDGTTLPGNDDLELPADGLKVLAPLSTGIVTEAPAWVAPGAKINVSANAPANAKGAVTYTWAIGPLPKTVQVTSADLNTKEIAAGASATLKFEKAGVYEMHCHPHPFMLSNVTVVDGYAGASSATVYITDGANIGEMRFVPEHVVIPVGGTVVYKNVGTQVHTATQSAQAPALTATELKAASGEVTVSGSGWQRLVVLIQDSEGRIGRAEHPIYVAPLPENHVESITFEFEAGVPNQAPREAHQVKSKAFKLAYPGTAIFNFTAVDAASATSGEGAANLAQVEIHVKEQGETQDTMTGDPASSGSLEGIVSDSTYTVEVKAVQGVSIKFTGEFTVVYDLTPPAPVDISAGGGGHDDSGGGAHAHH